ncbi:unnamed protein product [Strongylus vulgaris]|uniref:Uncharacterized protein n=1 Tax=Strongylus vulgaris TaxID=40348 RepID=A0A3P7INQ7_STRVU|nr:unnamed protein product [Strongylus vulgaris]
MGEERRSPSQAASVHEFDLDKVPEDADEDSSSGKEEALVDEAKAAATTNIKKEEDVVEQTNPLKTAANEKTSQPSVNNEVPELKKELESRKPLEKLEQVAKMVEEVKPENAEAEESKKDEKLFDDIDSDENDENVASVITDDNTWKHGDQEACTSKNAIFVQSIVRPCGQMCARTDLSYRMPSDCEWAKRKREKKEKAAAAAAAAAQQQSQTPTQPKKVLKETSQCTSDYL